MFERPTSNTEHRSWKKSSRSMFDVECSMFDVRLRPKAALGVTVHGYLRLPLPFTRGTFTGSLLVIRYLGPQSSGRSPRIARIHTNGFRPPRLRRGSRACGRRSWHASAPTAARTPGALLIAGRTESARSALAVTVHGAGGQFPPPLRWRGTIASGHLRS